MSLWSYFQKQFFYLWHILNEKNYWREFSSLWVLLHRKRMLSWLENMLWRHYSTLMFHSFLAKEESKLSSVLPASSEPQIW